MLVLVLQVRVLETFKDAVPFAFESLGGLLVEVFDGLGAIRVVPLDGVAAEFRGELEAPTLLGFEA